MFRKEKTMEKSTTRVLSRQQTPPTRLFLGLALIAVGVVFTLEQLGWIENARDLLRYWPVLLILAGLSKWVWPADSTGKITGLVLVAAGVWLLLAEWDLIWVEIWDLWPLLLIFIGARIALQGFFRARDVDQLSSVVSSVAVLGGTARTSASPDFKGGDLVAVMGSCDVDLRQAEILDGPAVIDAFTFWGGIEIRVPESWTVTVRGIPLLGGFDDETQPAEEIGGFRQELVVKGFAVMGGVEVRN